jgi:hypothetical protein
MSVGAPELLAYHDPQGRFSVLVKSCRVVPPVEPGTTEGAAGRSDAGRPGGRPGASRRTGYAAGARSGISAAAPRPIRGWRRPARSGRCARWGGNREGDAGRGRGAGPAISGAGRGSVGAGGAPGRRGRGRRAGGAGVGRRWRRSCWPCGRGGRSGATSSRPGGDRRRSSPRSRGRRRPRCRPATRTRRRGPPRGASRLASRRARPRPSRAPRPPATRRAAACRGSAGASWRSRRPRGRTGAGRRGWRLGGRPAGHVPDGRTAGGVGRRRERGDLAAGQGREPLVRHAGEGARPAPRLATRDGAQRADDLAPARESPQRVGDAAAEQVAAAAET